jgi:L-arabinose isomerase
MGDFYVEADVLQSTLGIEVTQVEAEALADIAAAVTDEEVAAEMKADAAAFDIQTEEDVHERSCRLGLGLRRYLEEGGYSAFSMNFLAFTSAEGPVNTTPFLEAAKAMARGIGYAGEGDVLTASLVGALSTAFTDVTFTEIFCPDWKGGSIFLSHMGEINPAISAEKPIMATPKFKFTDALPGAVITCAPAPGPGVFVNLVPGPNQSYSLILAPVEVLEDTRNAEMKKSVRGWVKPTMPVETFLEEYSRNGGTHHSALVMGDRVEALKAFAAFVGIDAVVIG